MTVYSGNATGLTQIHAGFKKYTFTFNKKKLHSGLLK